MDQPVTVWLLLAMVLVVSGQGQLFSSSNDVSLAVRSASLPLGVSQIIFAPTTNIVGTNTEGPNAVPVPGFGGSIAWTPSTMSYPRVIVGAPGDMTGASVGTTVTYGAVYVYDSQELSFNLLQTLLPPSSMGAAGTDPNSRFGITVAASRYSSELSKVSGGTNLFVGQPFAAPQDRSDETVYFFSASQEGSAGATRALYTLRQSLRLATLQTTGFGRALALSPDDQTLIIGAPGTALDVPALTRETKIIIIILLLFNSSVFFTHTQATTTSPSPPPSTGWPVQPLGASMSSSGPQAPAAARVAPTPP